MSKINLTSPLLGAARLKAAEAALPSRLKATCKLHVDKTGVLKITKKD